MLRPRDFVGVEYFVSVKTDYGDIWRRIVAFDQEDALAQLIAYCEEEGFTLLACAVK
ncbi:MAG TPA: hypothetical protein VJG29_00050 [Candidatus Paceibacterota bacterium]